EFDGLLDDLIGRSKRVFLDTKMFDIGETVRQGVARAAERGVSLVTVHGDSAIIRAAAEGKAGSDLKILVVPVLTSLDTTGLRELGYGGSLAELIIARARTTWACGCDGIIAAPQDKPNEIRRASGAEGLLVVTPGVRVAGSALGDHKRSPMVPITSSLAARSSGARIPRSRPIASSRICAAACSRAGLLRCWTPPRRGNI